MSRKRVNSQAPAPNLASLHPVGPARFTVERFLSNCTDATRAFLTENWAEGNQLLVDEIPIDGLPPVVILACYARQYGVDLVDDYDRLLGQYWWNIAEVFHPDKFFASSIVLMEDNHGSSPSDESFDAINISNIYEELFP